jgi:hypothetical protein
MIVAHPDDCVIFGWSLMHHYPKLDWCIVYLTYTANSDRGTEIREFWNRRRIPTQFLGFEDHWQDQEQGHLTGWSSLDAAASCWEAVCDADLVLTHDSLGDYGHIHHQVVHDAVHQHRGLITFAPPGQGTHHYQLPDHLWEDSELPMHAEIIKSFHTTSHRNSYRMTDSMHQWLENWK